MPEPTADARIARLWSLVLEGVADLAAHEVKDVLNGVSLNLEVIRSRATASDGPTRPIASFATAATAQLEILGTRAEALLYLTRPPREPADVGAALRHLGALLVPAAKANGGALAVEGVERPWETRASGRATRLALASALLGLVRARGAGRCRVESADEGPDAVVRFSHESARALTLDPEVVDAIGESSIRIRRSDADLSLVFPGP